MSGMQKKILARVEELADELGLEYTRDGEWANTGTVYFMNGLDIIAQFHYSFQSGYWGCTGLPHQPGSGPECGSYIRYGQDTTYFINNIMTKFLKRGLEEAA